MEFPRDETFLEQRRRFRLRHTCEFCVFFDALSGTCVHGWPNEAHREAYYASEHGGDDPVVFCKEFELAAQEVTLAQVQDQNPGAKAQRAEASSTNSPAGADRAPTES